VVAIVAAGGRNRRQPKHVFGKSRWAGGGMNRRLPVDSTQRPARCRGALMNQESGNSLVRRNLPALPTGERALETVRRVGAVGAGPEAVFVRVVPRGERWQDFLRRHRFRGVDALRRQQQADLTPPPEPGSLDKLI